MTLLYIKLFYPKLVWIWPEGFAEMFDNFFFNENSLLNILS